MCFLDGWGIVVPTSDDDFVRMCKALEVDLIDDPRVATREGRNRHPALSHALMDMCYAMAANLTQAEATVRFDAHRLPFAMVVSPDALPEDEHARAVDMFVERRHPIAGRTRLPRHPAAFQHTPASLAGDAPSLGEHTDEILRELGMADAVDLLRADGVIA
jgi:crotonobetainyl-CoA:carnitine CoA-transferase CaiB-like acyl-CoA transferase